MICKDHKNICINIYMEVCVFICIHLHKFLALRTVVPYFYFIFFTKFR